MTCSDGYPDWDNTAFYSSIRAQSNILPIVVNLHDNMCIMYTLMQYNMAYNYTSGKILSYLRVRTEAHWHAQFDCTPTPPPPTQRNVDAFYALVRLSLSLSLSPAPFWVGGLTHLQQRPTCNPAHPFPGVSKHLESPRHLPTFGTPRRGGGATCVTRRDGGTTLQCLPQLKIFTLSRTSDTHSFIHTHHIQTHTHTHTFTHTHTHIGRILFIQDNRDVPIPFSFFFFPPPVLLRMSCCRFRHFLCTEFFFPGVCAGVAGVTGSKMCSGQDKAKSFCFFLIRPVWKGPIDVVRSIFTSPHFWPINHLHKHSERQAGI